MISSDFKFNKVFIQETESTNSYARSLLKDKQAKEGDVFIADYQSGGRGQLHSKWFSEANKNLTFSFVIEANIELEDQFKISQIVCQGLIAFLDTMSVDACIKWPNDILIGKRNLLVFW